MTTSFNLWRKRAVIVCSYCGEVASNLVPSGDHLCIPCCGAFPVSLIVFRTWRTDGKDKNALYANFFVFILRCMEYLKAYLKTHKATALAQAVGISSSYLSDIKKGYRAPSLRVAFAIEDATEGAVPARSWLKQ
jgi:DNA-binding XRE family transcriptional regulator